MHSLPSMETDRETVRSRSERFRSGLCDCLILLD